MISRMENFKPKMQPSGILINGRIADFQPWAEGESTFDASLNRLSAVSDVGKLGSWKMDPVSRGLHGCRIFNNFFSLASLSQSYIVLLGMLDLESKKRIKDVWRAVGNDGVFSVEIKISPAGERGKWARLIARVQPSVDGKKKLVSGLIEDISLAKNREQESKDMVAFLNHELRTPLTVMRLFLQSANKSLGNKEIMVSQLLTKADEQISEIESLTEDYLNFSLMEHESVRLKIDSFDLAGLLADIVVEYTNLYPEYRFNINSPLSLFALADSSKISQVIRNLLNNSVKYSPLGTRISLGLFRQSFKVMVVVGDEGMGIGKTEIPKLFGKFYRSKAASSGAGKGYGIGLHLVKRIITAHKGMIAANSCLCLGSEFYFTLPHTEMCAIKSLA